MSGILLIDAEQPFASDLASALEGRGFAVKQLDDGKEGLDYARDHRPDLIVLCVELPKMSGYSICNKLKKDADLKNIPLIITSKEATPETFAQHKKLKTRAEDYLIKPFDNDALFEKIGALIPMPDGGSVAAGSPMDEPISLEADLDSLDMDATGDLPALDDDDNLLAGLEEPAASVDESLGDVDDVLAGLDDAGADGLPDLDAGDDALAGLEALGGGDLDLGASVDAGEVDPADMDASGFDDLDEMSFDDPPPAPAPAPAAAPVTPPPLPTRAAPAEESPVATSSAEDLATIASLRSENTDLKAKVAELEAKLRAAEENAKSAQEALSSSQSSSSSSARELLNLKEQVRARDKELDKLKDEIFEHEKKTVELQEELDRVRGEAQSVQQRIAEKDAEVAKLSAKVDALQQERDSLERDVQERLSAVAAERDRLRSEISSAQEERDRATAQLADKEQALRQAEDARRAIESKVEHLEQEKQKAEDQLMKAYEQLKAEETLREKAKKAAEVALQILSSDVQTTPVGNDLDLAGLDA